jgi:hypothetical protein
MVSSTRTKPAAVSHRFMPATTSLTVAAASTMWQDFGGLCRKYWHQWLDLCEELSYALAFYQEWQQRHRY